MATIKSTVEDLIGSIGDDTLITDAALATAREIVAVTPDDKLSYFVAKSSGITNASANQIENRRNIIVWRDEIECVEVPKGMESRVTDSSSIYYASDDSPVYIMDNTGIIIKPDPSGSKIAYIYSITVPAVAQDTVLPLTAFPEEGEYLLTYGTAIKCGQRLLSDKRGSFSMPPASPTLITTSAITGLPSAPAGITLADKSLTFTTPAPLYVSPDFTAPTYPIDVGSLSLPAPPTPPTIDLQSTSAISSPPTYTGPVTAPDYSDADNWINTEEDDAMAAARIGVINAKLSQFQIDTQNALNEFNEANTEYQTKLQLEIQDSQLKEGKENRELQKYQQDVQKYSSEVQSVVQKWQIEEHQMKILKWEKEYSLGMQKYQQDTASNLNMFNADVAEYQTEFQRAVKDAELSISNREKIEKFSQDLAKYASEVQTKVTEKQSEIERVTRTNTDKLTKYNADIQKYSAETQKTQSEHQQILQEISTLYQIYGQMLVAYVGNSQQQQQQRREGK